MPGKLGSAFLGLLDQISAEKTGTMGNIWSDLMQDAGRLQKLIKEHKELDRKAWLSALPKLEKQKSVYFKTDLGEAFIQTLKDKLKEGRHTTKRK